MPDFDRLAAQASAEVAFRDQVEATLRDDATFAASFYKHLRSQGVPRNNAAYVTGEYLKVRVLQAGQAEEGSE